VYGGYDFATADVAKLSKSIANIVVNTLWIAIKT